MFGKSNKLIGEVPDVETWFGTVPRSAATLLQMMTLDNWSTVARPIGDVHPHAWIFFVLWIGIASIGLLNLLTAVFIDALHDKTREAKERAVELKKQKKMMALQHISELFHEYDKDRSGALDKVEVGFMFQLFEESAFKDAMKEAEIQISHIKKARTACTTLPLGTPPPCTEPVSVPHRPS